MQRDILGIDSGSKFAIDIDTADLGLANCHCLCGQHIPHLTCTNAKSDCTKCTMSRGMGVTAGDGGTWLSDALLGTDDVYNPLIAGRQIKEGYACLSTVLTQFLHHRIC